MPGLGRTLIVIGAVLIGVGLVISVVGRVPGDLQWRGKHTVFYFPLGTCLLISALMSLVFWLFGRR
jgi:Protein of unknown function (DUF2905)